MKEILSEADTMERNGDVAGALNAYVSVAEDYPESDPGLSRLDSFVGRMRAGTTAAGSDGQRMMPQLSRAHGTRGKGRF